MKAFYSIGTKFGGTGIGRAGAKSLTRIAVEHELTIAASDFEGAPPRGVRAVKIRPPLRLPFVQKKKYRCRKARAFDRAVSNLLQEGTAVFQSWNGDCLDSLKKARNLGIATIVTRASSHMLTQMEILTEEFERFGIHREVQLPEMIDRCVEEYAIADLILVPSEFVKQSFLDRGFAEEKLLMAPFGVDSLAYRPAEHCGDVFRVLFVGRIGLRKGVHYLLEAWKRLALSDAELVLVGNIEPGFERIMQEYRGLKGLVVPGFARNPADLFASSSVFAFPSLEEGSALVTYEAMASGLPLVTTFNSGSIVRDGMDGFLVPIRDVDAVCDRISQIYQDRELGREMGASARTRVADYTWERHGETLAGYYGKIEETRSGARA